MQQKTTWYFVFGHGKKTSLAAEYCRENAYVFLQDPAVEELQTHLDNNIMIEGSENLFMAVEKLKKQLIVIKVGEEKGSVGEESIVNEYSQIGACIRVVEPTYEQFRKNIYPNLIFLYGPVHEQNQQLLNQLSKTIGYLPYELPKCVNTLLTELQKTQNYMLNGLWTRPEELLVLEQYFHISVIHLKYERADLPNYDDFFDAEYDLEPFLKTKKYYLCVEGNQIKQQIYTNVGVKLCPSLIYVEGIEENQEYVNQYVQSTNALLLNMSQIHSIYKRKNSVLEDLSSCVMGTLTKILYANLQLSQILITGLKFSTEEFREFESMNREFSHYVDLTDIGNYKYTSDFTSSIFYLQQQKRLSPNVQNTLKEELNQKVQYWIVNGPGTCGKTTVSKYMSEEFGFKHIQFETYMTSLKEKLASPEEGEEVPLKKYLSHFSSLIHDNPLQTYVLDGFPYAKNELEQWIKVVGAPIILNLRVQENEQIKRGRKKAEGDLTAEVSEEETAKAKQNTDKISQWVEELGELCPVSKIYQVDYNMPSLLAQSLLNSILRPRVFLVQKNREIVYENIAIKYDMGFVNLELHPLRKCLPYIRKCEKRDIILNYYSQESEHLVSEDLYWIEKHVGEIRYLGIWEQEEKNINEQKLQLQRPPVQEKPKPAEGEEPEEKEQEQGNEEQKKKKFDIYEYEWTNPKLHKNLSQWFFKLKKNIVQRNNQKIQCFEKFGEIINLLNNSRQPNVYEIVS